MDPINEYKGTMRTFLYRMIGSPPARAVMMTIDILGIENEIEQRDLNPVFREQDTPEFTKKNPMRTIPILDEGDFSLADSHAIILYLIDKYGKPEHSHLYPIDKRKRATVNQRLFFDCGILFPRLRAVMAPTYAGKLTEISKGMIRNIEYAYTIMEAYLSENLYLADNIITLADISAVSTMGSLSGLHPVDEKRYPKLANWMKKMNEKDYCKKINIPGSQMHVEGLIALMNNAKEMQKSKL